MIRQVRDYAIFEFAEDLSLRSWNEGVRELLGFDEAEWLASTGDIIFTPEDRERGAHWREPAVAAQEGCAVDNRWHLRKDGSRFWANGSVTAIRDDDGSLRGFVKVLQDRTRELQAEQELRGALLRLDAAVQSGGIMTWLWDLREDTITGNESLLRLLGASDQESRSISFEKFLQAVHPDDRERVQEAVARSLRGGTPVVVDYRVHDTEGNVHWLSVRGELHVDGSGAKNLLTGVLVDITSHKSDEELLRGVNDLLNREYEALDYTVSHDLRTPLRSIHGFAQILRQDYGDRLDESGREHLDRISEAARRMGELIDALLDLSRIPRLPFHPQSVNLSALARRVANQVSRAFPGHQVEVRIQPDMIAQGDPKMLQLALEQLLTNSYRFTQGRDVAVVEFGRTEDGAGEIFFLRDNGSGFRMEHSARLFAPFQRLHDDSRHGGLGVGLALVRQVIDRHRGKIWADSAPGQGATFYFTLGGHS